MTGDIRPDSNYEGLTETGAIYYNTPHFLDWSIMVPILEINTSADTCYITAGELLKSLLTSIDGRMSLDRTISADTLCIFTKLVKTLLIHGRIIITYNKHYKNVPTNLRFRKLIVKSLLLEQVEWTKGYICL